MKTIRKYLSDEEATLLGLPINPKQKGRKKGRYRINPEKYEELKGKKVVKIDNKTTTKTSNGKPFVLSAWNNKGYMMNIDEYCENYSLPRQDITSYKLVSHTGVPFYNIVFKEHSSDNTSNWEDLKGILKTKIKKGYKYNPTKKNTLKTQGVVKWSDLHFGAHIHNLIKTPNYDSNILEKMLHNSIDKVNLRNFKKTHIHINGDLIESFSGLNHINSWQSMNKNETGANAIMLCTEMLDRVLQRVVNLGCIKIVAGNHDRLSKNNDEDVKGGAAELIAWGLSLKGYDVEFNPMVITHVVDGICHINLHGHLGISKRTTEAIILDYGKPDKFNLICEGHLHSLIEKLSVKRRKLFKLVSSDTLNYRRMHLHSFFTGNYYSESLGFTTNAGFSIFNDNGFGKPEHNDIPL